MTFAGGIGPPALAREYRPHPNWTSRVQGSDKLLTGGCHGHANTPHSAKDQYGQAGIGFDGYQDCVGSFSTQKVCAKLQERDYYGVYYDRTSLVCGAETVATHAYFGRWASCASARHGIFRTFAQGVVYPYAGLPATSTGTSYSATLC